MGKTRIFVSSTCYDLGPVREDLRNLIQTMGHEPVLSEYASFPVNPEFDAITNCRRNVESNADIFVLIVGGKRGSLDAQSGKSITNLEYDTALTTGVPLFVFVKKSVQTLLPHWRRNTEGDFSPDVDAPEVFRFLEDIQKRKHWSYGFERTEEIKEVLRIQLSGYFHELLNRAKRKTLDPLTEFASESAEAERIAREKPKYWEFFLAAELMRNRMNPIMKRYSAVKDGLKFIRGERVAGSDFLGKMQDIFDDCLEIGFAMKRQLKLSLQASMGPPGEPGDPLAIKDAVTDLMQLCTSMIDCEEQILALRPPDHMLGVKDALKGLAEDFLGKFHAFPNDLTAPFAYGANPTGPLSFMIVLDGSFADRVSQEIRALNSL